MYFCALCNSSYPAYIAGCTYCWSSRSLMVSPGRTRAAVDGEVELTTARELSRTKWQDAGLPAYTELILRRKALIVLVGRSGSGKSTMTVRGLDSLRGPSLLLSVEEPAGPTLAERLNRVGAKDERMHVCSRATRQQLVTIVRQLGVVALAIDSVQRAMFEPRDLRHLLQVCPSLNVLIGISQINRNGDVRGGEELAHEADVLLELADLTWHVRKSRYQPTGASGAVLAPQTDPKEEEDHVPT